MPHELFLTTRQTTKIKNVFANNTSTYIRLRKYQISKITQSRGSFGSWLCNFGKKVLTNIAIFLARENLPGLISNLISNAINEFERKLGGTGADRAGKGFASFILNKDVNDIIVKSLDYSSVLIDEITETVKQKIKKNKKVDSLEL